MYNLIRYPGSKAKLWAFILRNSPPSVMLGGMFSSSTRCYCEPFIGSGAVTRHFLRNLSNDAAVILNDRDPWIVSLWKSVRQSHEEIIRLIESKQELTAEDFYECKELDGDPSIDPVEAGFRKLVLHRSSFSGLGAMAGGPLGGQESNNSRYDPSCRWSPFTLIESVRKAHELMARFKRMQIRCEDFSATLARVPNDPSSFAYLDPPYFDKGEELYKYAFDEQDHARLAETLKAAKYLFALSYDDCEPIRRLYGWANIKQFNMTPTVQTSRAPRRKNSELVITNY